MTVENFNQDYWKGKTFKQFAEHEKHHGYTEAEMQAIYHYLNPEKQETEKPLKKVKQSETPM